MIEQWDEGVWPGKENCVIREDSFLIGNHADELTVSLDRLLELTSAMDTATLPNPHLTRPAYIPPLLHAHPRCHV